MTANHLLGAKNYILLLVFTFCLVGNVHAIAPEPVRCAPVIGAMDQWVQVESGKVISAHEYNGKFSCIAPQNLSKSDFSDAFKGDESGVYTRSYEFGSGYAAWELVSSDMGSYESLKSAHQSEYESYKRERAWEDFWDERSLTILVFIGMLVIVCGVWFAFITKRRNQTG
jgi:hypothetical protein